jgi:phosphatidylserine synthase
MDLDPELKKQLQQLLATLLANAQDAATWAKGEIPLLIREKIAFGRAWDTSFLILCIIALAVMYKWPFQKWRSHEFNDNDNKWLAAVLLLILPTIALCIMTLVMLNSTLLVWFAPRLYIVEWLFDLVRSAKS